MNENILIKNAKLEYLTTKTDNYDNEVSYFKIIDKTIENKMQKWNNDDFKMPFFKAKQGKDQILKVKQKYIRIKNLTKEEPLSVDIQMKFYELNDITGFYVSKLT